METLEKYVDDLTTSMEKLWEESKPSETTSLIKQNLGMLEDIVLKLAGDIDNIKSKTK